MPRKEKVLSRMKNNQHQRFLLFLNLSILTVIVFVDHITPLGIASGILYIFCILITLWMKHKYITIYFAILATLLIVVMTAFNVAHAPLWIVSVNRFYAVVAIWITALVIQYKKRSDLKAKELDVNYHTIIESIPLAILLSDANRQITFSNHFAHQIFDYTEKALIHLKLEDLVPKITEEKYRDLHRDFLSQQSPKRVNVGEDLYACNQQGEEIPIEIELIPITLNSKLSIMSIIMDITERKKSEKELALFTQELQRSNDELNDFAYIASHDLREPLRGIHNYAQFLLEDYSDKLDDEGKKKLVLLPKMANRLEALIETLLKYSRVGRFQLVLKESCMQTIVDEVIESIGLSIEQSTTKVIIPKKLPKIHCDPIYMREVFYNLISNAIKYNDADDPQIEIGCTTSTEVIFYVKDNGIGIEPKHKDKIFKLFKRLHRQDKYGGGVGAGLTIVKKIVDRHHGEIWLDSVKNQGTIFYIKIPKCKEGENAKKQ